MAREPIRVRAYLLAVDAAALGWGLAAVVDWRASRHGWVVAALLAGLAVVFEEGARRVGRLLFRISNDTSDMSAVWLVAAAIVLRDSLVVVVTVLVVALLWVRQQRPAGERLYRKVFAGSRGLLACLGTNAVLQASEPSWHGAHLMLADAIAVAVGMVSFAVISRALAICALVLAGVRGLALVGAHEENFDELATFCLGGLVALAALRAPWLCPLVLPPMMSLQRGALVRQLETAASVDPKTRLLNAVAWEELARRELARARRTDRPVAVLILDIDRFKRVNDRYGHLVGDDVLRRVGHCLQSNVREFDTVGRFGGEEFVVVLPDASEPEALIVAERLRSRINDLQMSAVVPDAEGTHEPLSASIGVACLPEDGTELTELLLAADGALYDAKARGRNCVMLAGRGNGGRISRAAGG
jgi:diguanylate cyclase (GGDEF)-like protein